MAETKSLFITQINKKQMSNQKKIFYFFFFLISFQLFSQTPSIKTNIRVALWSQIDAYPELEYKEETPYSYPINELKELAPFIFSGMIYGWKFIYTPSDKQRKVDEYFELIPIQEINEITNPITYKEPWIQDNKLYSWCECSRTKDQYQNYLLWSSIQNPVINGIGKGDIKKGFLGIKEATINSVKNAIREHYRKLIKNKPKEIQGSVLIREIPTIGIDAGQYIINLDFFLEYGKIREYTQY